MSWYLLTKWLRIAEPARDFGGVVFQGFFDASRGWDAIRSVPVLELWRKEGQADAALAASSISAETGFGADASDA